MGKPVIPITYEERVQIEKLLKKGLSCGKIAIEIGRSKNGVVAEVRERGGRDNYTAKQAQAIADEKNREKKEKLHKLNVGNKRTFFMKQRIENLEMQVEILYETLKELKNDSKH